MIRQYLSDIINDHKTHGKWKIYLTIAIYFTSSMDSGKTCTMHCKSNNIEIIIGNQMDGITEEFSETPLQCNKKD